VSFIESHPRPGAYSLRRPATRSIRGSVPGQDIIRQNTVHWESLLHGKVNARLRFKYEYIPKEYYEYLSTGMKYNDYLEKGKLEGLQSKALADSEMKAKVDRLEEFAEETSTMLEEHGMKLEEHDTHLEDLDKCIDDHADRIKELQQKQSDLRQKQSDTDATLAQVMPLLQKLQEEQGGVENADVKMEDDADIKMEDDNDDEEAKVPAVAPLPFGDKTNR